MAVTAKVRTGWPWWQGQAGHSVQGTSGFWQGEGGCSGRGDMGAVMTKVETEPSTVAVADKAVMGTGLSCGSRGYSHRSGMGHGGCQGPAVAVGATRAWPWWQGYSSGGCRAHRNTASPAPTVSLAAQGGVMALAQVPSPWEARPKQQTKPQPEATIRLWNGWQGHRCGVPVTPPTPQHPKFVLGSASTLPSQSKVPLSSGARL